MWSRVIEGHIARTNRNLLVINGLVLLVFVSFFALTFKANYNLVFGPFETTGEELAKVDDLGKLWKYNIKLKPDAISKPVYENYTIYTDEETGKETERRTDALFQFMLLDGSGMLIVKSREGVSSDTVSGGLTQIPDTLRSDLVFKLDPEDQKVLLPFMLDTTRFDGWAYAPFVMWAPFLGLSIWNLLKVRRRIEDPSSHPINKRLSKQGRKEEVVAQIEEELRAGTELIKGTPVKTSSSWIILPSAFDMVFGRFEDVGWAYLKKTTHFVYFLPVGVSYRGRIHFNDKTVMDFSGSEKGIMSLMEKIAEKAPWCMLGYDPDVSKDWSIKTDEMIRAVEDAKARYYREKSGSMPDEVDPPAEDRA